MLPSGPRSFSQPESVVRMLELAAGRKWRLWLAVTYRDAQRVRQLLAKGHDPLLVNEDTGLTLFRQAGLRGDVEILEALAEAGAWDAELTTNRGNSAVLSALVRGNKEALRWMVERGADVDRVDDLGRNVMMKAIEIDRSGIATWLARRTSDLGTADHLGNTALHLACRGGKVGVVKALLRAGADVDSRNGQGERPVDVCASGRLRELFQN